jgi:hypothetical protein
MLIYLHDWKVLEKVIAKKQNLRGLPIVELFFEKACVGVVCH